jgi:predicted anti-sigma-YlaC factor YlaD
MLNCKEMTEMCSQELERQLLWSERMSLRMHLMMCSGCNNFRKQMQTMRIAMQQYASGAAISTSDEPAGEG